MKKIFITVGVLSSAISFAQIRTNKSISQDAVADQTPFLDASSTPDWNTSTNIGKGLVFPRVDLTKLTTIAGPSRPGSNNAPTYYDGMVVYNIATGNSGLGNVAIKPGFYYYENKTTTLNGGTWKPLGSGEVLQGADGKSVLNGAGVPAAGTGTVGDFYVDTTNNRIYGPKTASGWGTGTSLVGPAGPQGVAGATGPQGPAGARGATGPAGPQGAAGATGPQGPQGIAGATGAKGADGKSVLSGTTVPATGTGAVGDFYINTATNTIYGPKTASGWGTGTSLVGAQGPQGVAGATGPQGPAGARGATGPAGPQGAAGATGPQGPQGIAGATGAKGADGKSVLSGTTVPATGTGAVGDFYINTATNTIYGPKTASGWGAGVSLVGPAGPQGVAGATGPQGPAGARGATGPAGPQGAAGATGPQGPQGIAGAAGAKGADGKSVLSGTTVPATGTGAVGDFYINTATNTIYGPKTASGWGAGVSLVGPAGPQGVAGATGPQGPAGARGATGPAGPQGAAGATGPQGPQGIAGAAGAKGADGKSVLSGTTVPATGTGAVGDFYIDTATNRIYGPKTASGWGTGTSLVGPAGPQGVAGATGPQGPAGARGATGPAGPQGAAGAKGADGKSVLSGTTAPATGTGAVGDFYIDTATNRIYGPKTASGWGTGTSLVGPAGPAGARGATGPAGPAGAVGAQGPAGAAGAKGADGKSVLSGTTAPATGTGAVGDFYINTATNTIYGPKTASGWGTGTSLVGAQGPQGVAGATGPQGPAGARGATGPAGPQGAAGATGAKGADGKSVLSGTTAPATGTGAVGDFYIDTATNRIYGPKTASGWGTGTSLVGPAGPQGVAGARGATGATGPQGPQGIAGATGPQGPAGARGPEGPSGVVTASRGLIYTAATKDIALPAGTSNNQVLKWNGTAWAPAVDTDTNTTYTAGTGLTLTGTAFSHAAHTGDVTGTTALTIANNAVTSAKIADGTIVNADLANNAVTGAKIANATITADKLAAGVIPTDTNTNIYNTDGTLTAVRTVDTGNHNLNIKGNSWYPLIVNSSVAESGNSGGIAIHPNDFTKRVEVSTTTDGDFRFWAGGNRMSIKRNTGNVGIGTAEPTEKLDVQGSIKSSALAGTGERIVVADATGVLKTGTLPASANIYNTDGTLSGNRTVTMGSNSLIFNGNGKIGIGITPEKELDVNGQIRSHALGGNGYRNVVVTNDGTLHTGPVPTPSRVVYINNDEINMQDYNGFIYVRHEDRPVINLLIPEDLPIGFNCVIIQKGYARVRLVPKTPNVKIETARGIVTRTRNSAIGIVVGPDKNTITITGDAEEN